VEDGARARCPAGGGKRSHRRRYRHGGRTSQEWKQAVLEGRSERGGVYLIQYLVVAGVVLILVYLSWIEEATRHR
jgi:hypothetical protein